MTVRGILLARTADNPATEGWRSLLHLPYCGTAPHAMLDAGVWRVGQRGVLWTFEDMALVLAWEGVGVPDGVGRALVLLDATFELRDNGFSWGPWTIELGSLWMPPSDMPRILESAYQIAKLAAENDATLRVILVDENGAEVLP